MEFVKEIFAQMKKLLSCSMELAPKFMGIVHIHLGFTSTREAWDFVTVMMGFPTTLLMTNVTKSTHKDPARPHKYGYGGGKLHRITKLGTKFLGNAKKVNVTKGKLNGRTRSVTK